MFVFQTFYVSLRQMRMKMYATRLDVKTHLSA